MVKHFVESFCFLEFFSIKMRREKMTFTTEVRIAAEPIWQQSKQHSFISELKAGTLAPEKFRFYLLQDRYYLEEFSRIQLKAAALTSDESIRQQLLQNVESLKSAEIHTRKLFFADLQITDKEIAQTSIAPNAYHYVAHLQHKLNTGSVAVTQAALLPCYWLYQEIGTELIKSGSPVPIYQRWIETYDQLAYQETVRRQKELTDYLAEQASDEERAAMKEAFLISSYEEVDFWEMAYTIQQWGQKNEGIQVNPNHQN
jgi:thiaminase/transcriptional activator TenA